MPAELWSRIPEFVAALDPHVNDGLREGADLIAERAKERVPVETGHLRDAIHVSDASGFGAGFTVLAGDTEAFYGHLVEFGTVHSSAEPFLVPALEESKDQVAERVSEALGGL